MKINQYEFIRDGKPFEPTREEIIKFAKHELAEKDKQIKYLKDLCEEERLRAIELQQQTREEKTMFDMYRANTIQKGIVDPKATKIIRKQVCDELRNWLNENFIRIGRVKNNEPMVIAFDYEELMKFLDKIEKGEKQ